MPFGEASDGGGVLLITLLANIKPRRETESKARGTQMMRQPINMSLYARVFFFVMGRLLYRGEAGGLIMVSLTCVTGLSLPKYAILTTDEGGDTQLNSES